jgi:hypothetical protein
MREPVVRTSPAYSEIINSFDTKGRIKKMTTGDQTGFVAGRIGKKTVRFENNKITEVFLKTIKLFEGKLERPVDPSTQDSQ